MRKTYCDQIQSDMSKVADTGDKRSEKRNQIGKSKKGFYQSKKKKNIHSKKEKSREESQER